MTQVTPHEAQATLPFLIQQALAGEEVVIAGKNDVPVYLTCHPLAQNPVPSPQRKLGLWRGKVRITPDFDAPNPEFNRYFE